jgi:hypothetical protein
LKQVLKESVNQFVIFQLTVGSRLGHPARMARKMRLQYPGAIYHVGPGRKGRLDQLDKQRLLGDDNLIN